MSYYCVKDFETRSCGDAAAAAVQSALAVQRGRPARPPTPLLSVLLAVQTGIFFNMLHAVVHIVPSFQNICYLAVQHDLPFHTSDFLPFAFCTLDAPY